MTDKQNSENRLSRRDLLQLGGTAAALAAAPSTVSAAGSSFSRVDGWTGYRVPNEVERYSGNPGFIISYADGEFSKLDDWVSGSDERSLINHDSDHGVATVSCPINHVTHAGLDVVFGDAPLEAMGYVESVALDAHVDVVPGIQSLKARDQSSVPAGWKHLFRGSLDQSDVAYRSDVKTSTIADVRAAVGADTVSETGSGVTVSVIDDGVTYDSSLYGDRVTAAKNFISDTSIDVSASNPDWTEVESAGGHGDWVASSILADPSDSTYTGIAPGADLIICKALNSDGGSTTDIAEAIRYSADNGADLINMSLGSPIYSPELVSAIEYARENGVVISVTAAGNSRQTRRFIDSPADSPTKAVLSVGATTTSTNPDEVKTTYFSSVAPDNSVTDFSQGATLGEKVDIGAPGMKIEAQTPDGPAVLSGTSMASPIVTGCLALLLESESGLTTEEIRTRVHDTAHRLKQVGETECGHGLVAIDRAIANTEAEKTQTEVRNNTARARDQANRAMGGGIARRLQAAQYTISNLN